MRCRFEPTTTILISSHSPPSFPSFLDRQFITLTTGAPEKLLRRANRLVAGRPLDASCSAKLANVTELTDGLMVVALEQLEAAVAGEGANVGVTAQRRLFAKLVAGAMGVVLALSVDLKVVGLRIDKQARKVRDQLAFASRFAAEGRVKAADGSAVAEINAGERREVDRLRLERYQGFHELGSAGALAAPASAAAPPSPESPSPAAGELPRWMDTLLGAHGAQAVWEHLMGEEPPPNGPIRTAPPVRGSYSSSG